MTTRPLTLADVPAVADLINRFERHWDLPVVSSPAIVADDFTAPFTDLDRDTIGLWEGSDLVAYGLVWHRASGEREERAYLQGLVDPAHMARGLGRTILAWELNRARDSLSECDPTLPWYIRVDEWDWIEPAHRLYRRFGLEPVRYMKEMIRPLDVPARADAPGGVRLADWDRARDEQARLTLNDAFADHWGSTPSDAEAFRHRLEGYGTRLDLSLLALSGEDVVGVCINAVYPEDEAATGRREGWVVSLGVRREWRERGLASALLADSFRRFRAAGLTHSILGVDSENPTGAFRLYEKMGYRVLHGTVTSQLEVERPGKPAISG